MVDFKEYVKENKMKDSEYVYGIFLTRFADVEKGSSEYWALKRIYEATGKYIKSKSTEEKRKFIEEYDK